MSCDNMKFDRNIRRTYKLLFIIKKRSVAVLVEKTDPDPSPVQILERNLGSGTVNIVCPQKYILYWKNPGYLYNKRGEPGESDIIE